MLVSNAGLCPHQHDLNLTVGPPTHLRAQKRERPMMRLMIFAIAVVALVAVTVTTLHSRSPSVELSAAAMPSLQELHVMANVHKLPTQEIDDQSLVYPTVEKH
jgi:hypothetical protein